MEFKAPEGANSEKPSLRMPDTRAGTAVVLLFGSGPGGFFLGLVDDQWL